MAMVSSVSTHSRKESRPILNCDRNSISRNCPIMIDGVRAIAELFGDLTCVVVERLELAVSLPSPSIDVSSLLAQGFQIKLIVVLCLVHQATAAVSPVGNSSTKPLRNVLRGLLLLLPGGG